MTMTRILSSLLAFVMAFALVASVPSAQAAAGFSDVSASAWYAGDVADVQKYGILQGVGGSRFDPNGTLTLAQAVTMATRTDAALRGVTIGASQGAWYQPYVDYAASRGISAQGEFGWNYNAACSRLTMAKLFARVFPAKTQCTLNQVTCLPDLAFNESNKDVFFLYQQGVLTGSDKYGSFHPQESITRAEAAAILNRELDSSKRKAVFISDPPAVDLMERLNKSKAWQMKDPANRDWFLSLAFQADHKLYAVYGIMNSDEAEIFTGTWKSSGDKVTVTFQDWEGFQKTVTYQMKLTNKGFTWTQTDSAGVAYNHSKGTVLSFTQDNHWQTASSLKSFAQQWW